MPRGGRRLWKYPDELKVPDPRTHTKCGNQCCSLLISANGYTYGSSADTSRQRVLPGKAGYDGWCVSCQKRFDNDTASREREAAKNRAKHQWNADNAATVKEQAKALGNLEKSKTIAARTAANRLKMAKGEIPASFALTGRRSMEKRAAEKRSSGKRSTASMANTDTSQDVAVGEMDDMEIDTEDDMEDDTEVPSEDPTASSSDLGSTTTLTGLAPVQQRGSSGYPSQPYTNYPGYPRYGVDPQQQSSAYYSGSETTGYSSQASYGGTAQQPEPFLPPGQRGIFAQRNYPGHVSVNPRHRPDYQPPSETSEYSSQTSQGRSLATSQSTAESSSLVSSSAASYSQSEFQSEADSGQQTSYADSEIPEEGRHDTSGQGPQALDNDDPWGNFRLFHPIWGGIDTVLFKRPDKRVSELYDLRRQQGEPIWRMKGKVAAQCTGGVRYIQWLDDNGNWRDFEHRKR